MTSTLEVRRASSPATPASASTRGAVVFDGDVVVRGRCAEADDVITLEFAAIDGQPLPTWQPGAHIDVLLPGGMTRQYSLCGSPDDSSTWRIGVLREPDGRGGSRWLHDHAQPGTRLRVAGTRNHFAFDTASHYLFIAGGIGITPLLPMIAAAQARGVEWRLHYLGRRRAAMPFLPELAKYDDRVNVVARDEVERLDLRAVLAETDSSTHVYGCGPTRLLDALEESCSERPALTLHVERFSAEPATLKRDTDTQFDVELRATGTTITVPADCSVLQAVLDAGVYVASSCSEGTCGSCETDVLEGEVDHRDSVLSPAEKAANESMMICVSRARCGRLVLDL